MYELRAEEVRDLHAFHTLGLERVKVIPIEQFLFDGALASLWQGEELQRMPDNLTHIHKAHRVEEVHSNLDTIIDAHRCDVLRCRHPSLVPMESADVFMDPEGPRAATIVCVELEGTFVFVLNLI